MSKISVYSLAPLSGDKETSSIRFISAMVLFFPDIEMEELHDL
jgi:hypothetical protein